MYLRAWEQVHTLEAGGLQLPYGWVGAPTRGAIFLTALGEGGIEVDYLFLEAV